MLEIVEREALKVSRDLFTSLSVCTTFIWFVCGETFGLKADGLVLK